jgi:N utilization substance protein A
MNGEILRTVDMIHRERTIDKELIFSSIEEALCLSAKKYLGLKQPIIKIDRITGKISAFDGSKEIDPKELGRIVAQSAKQVLIQKIREAERDNIFSEFETKKNDIVSVTVARFEGPHIICSIGKAEATLLKADQASGEFFKIGQRFKAYVIDVEKKGTRTKIYLSRASSDFVKRLFELEVPEISEGLVIFKGVARDPGYRTKIAVTSNNEKIDPVGACIGARGSRIKGIVDELNGENIDVIRWSEDPAIYVKNALKPAEVAGVKIEPQNKKAVIDIISSQLSLAIGKGGRNVRLASMLVGWDIDIVEIVEEDSTSQPDAEAQKEKEDESK